MACSVKENMAMLARDVSPKFFMSDFRDTR